MKHHDNYHKPWSDIVDAARQEEMIIIVMVMIVVIISLSVWLMIYINNISH